MGSRNYDLTKMVLPNGSNELVCIAKAGGLHRSDASNRVNYTCESTLTTWTLASSIPTSLEKQQNYAVSGVYKVATPNGVVESTFTGIHVTESTCVISIFGDDYWQTYYYRSGGRYGASGNYIETTTRSNDTNISTDKSTDAGVELRTFTITGGRDAAYSDFVTFINAVATRQD